jgi:hypothetical protein
MFLIILVATLIRFSLASEVACVGAGSELASTLAEPPQEEVQEEVQEVQEEESQELDVDCVLFLRDCVLFPGLRLISPGLRLIRDCVLFLIEVYKT